MLFGGNCVMQAQNEKDEIIVTDNNGKEETIDLPEAMNYEVDSLLNLYYSKTYLQQDEDCNYRDENRDYPKEVYIERLSRLPNVMEMPYNEIVQKFIDRYTGRLRHSVSYMLGASNFYIPIFEEALEAYGLPLELKYLPVIESALNPKATSHAGAAGLWQFMSGTGREFGLEVNSNIDERYHVEKETRAACKYLKEAYAKYGNWLCVAAAYNAGQGRISTQLQKQMVSQAADLWLVEETSRYMFRLLAAKAVISNPQRYGFLLKREHLYPAIPYTEVTVTTGIDNLAQFAKNKGITYAQLKDANPWLRDTSLMNKSGRTYILKIPTQAGMHYDPRKTIPYNKNWVIN